VLVAAVLVPGACTSDSPSDSRGLPGTTGSAGWRTLDAGHAPAGASERWIGSPAGLVHLWLAGPALEGVILTRGGDAHSLGGDTGLVDADQRLGPGVRCAGAWNALVETGPPGHERSAVLLRSTDGAHWSAAPTEGLPEAAIRSLACLGDARLVAGGATIDDAGRFEVATWVSADDGSTWRAGAMPGASAPPDDEAGFRFRGLAVARGVAVAIGDGEHRSQVWSSTDGKRWRRLVPVGLSSAPSLVDLAAAGDVLVAIASNGEDEWPLRVARSTDGGATWTVEDLGVRVDGASVRSVAGWLVVAAAPHDDPTATRIWASADGRSWRRLRSVEAARPAGVVGLVDGPVLEGPDGVAVRVGNGAVQAGPAALLDAG
jgi:hypothetical protein